MEINKEAGQCGTGAGKVNRRWKKRGMQEGRLTLGQNLMGEYGMEGRAGDGCIEISPRRYRNKYAGMLKKQ